MKVGIIGLGLIGGSLGRVLVSHGHEVYGADLSPSVMKKAILVKAMNEELTMDIVPTLDMLVVAVYPRDFYAVAENYLPYMQAGSTVIDICGNKRIVMEAMEELHKKYPDINFVGTHPMAGKEYSGIERSSVRLFEGASIILVPLHNDITVLSSLKNLFLSLGFGEVVFTDAENHDAMIAYTSQLCHIVSNAFIKSDSADKHSGYSAGSYKDLTRVARLSPAMWSQLMIDNRDKLTDELENLVGNLNKYLVALKEGDESALRELLAEGDNKKRQIDKR